ncbi:MAG TPA: hypothetical protein VNL77_20090 [Roseiflexaceae bacterium]|nr:hypothetical protein [Roseiflexaceae bacterium]
MRDSVVVKPRRKRGAGAMALLVLLLLLAGVSALGAAAFAPISLGFVQEHVLGLVHGGVVATEERTFVDACAQLPDAEGPQAVTRTVRTTTFRDGTQLSVTFTSGPMPTITKC